MEENKEFENKYGERLNSYLDVFKQIINFGSSVSITSRNIQSELMMGKDLINEMFDDLLKQTDNDTLINTLNKTLLEKIYIAQNRVFEITEYISQDKTLRVFLEFGRVEGNPYPNITISKVKFNDYINREMDNLNYVAFGNLISDLNLKPENKDEKTIREIKEVNEKLSKSKNIILKKLLLEGWRVILEVEAIHGMNNSKKAKAYTMYKKIDTDVYNIQMIMFDSQSHILIGVSSHFYLTKTLIDAILKEVEKFNGNN